MDNGFQIVARYKKAVAFAAHLYSHGIVSGELNRITRQQWNDIARAIDQNWPSTETLLVIRSVMQEFETAVAARIEVQNKQQSL